MIVESHSDETPAVRQPLGIDDGPVRGCFIKGRDCYCLASPPEALGEYAGAMCADIIRVGPFCIVGSHKFRIREANHHDDW